SLDIIALMDVLEHLPDPVSTVRHCVTRLKSGGVLLIQTPQFPEGQSFEELSRAGNRFLEMLKPNEHLYLFSERSVRRLFEHVGFTHFAFEPALFRHYDMFFLVSDAPIVKVDPAAEEAALLKRPDGRLMQALLDLQKRLDVSVPRTSLEASEADREARLRVIEHQGNQLGEAATREASLLGEVDGLRRALDASEADRGARLAVIERLGSELSQVSQRREALASELDASRQAFEASELDREARLRVIERQGQELGEAELKRQTLVADLDELRQAYTKCDEERSDHRRVIQQQQERALKTLEQHVSGLQAEIERVQSSRDASERARMEALANVDRQTAELMALTTALQESGEKMTKIEQSNKEMKQVISRGIFRLIFDRLRGRI
ncbi:MAG: methyltransferase domain-containing protein, partial [Vicinamibacterales bacterium]